MTVGSAIARSDALGNGSNKNFTYGFKILSESDLQVIVRDLTGIEVTQILNTDYTVTGVKSDSGGLVVFTTAPVNLYAVSIQRIVPLLQNTSIRNQGPYNASLHEDRFDRDTFVHQQLNDALQRSLHLPQSEAATTGATELPSASARADTIIIFDSAGNLAFGAVPPSVGVGLDRPFVMIGNDATTSAERSLVGTANQVVVTDGGANSTVTLSLPQSIHTGGAPTFNAITITTDVGTATVTAAGQVSAGFMTSVGTVTAGAFTTTGLVTTGGAVLTPETTPGGPANGRIWVDTDTNSMFVRVLGLSESLVGTTFVSTADAAFSNSSSETSMIGTGVGTLTFPANFWKIGKAVRIRMTGRMLTLAATPGNLTIKAKFGATVLATTGTVNLPLLSLSNYFSVDVDLVCRAVGATGTISSNLVAVSVRTTDTIGSLFTRTATIVEDHTLLASASATATNNNNVLAALIADLNSAVPSTFIAPVRNDATVDTTASGALDVTGQFSVANVGNEIRMDNVTVEVLR